MAINTATLTAKLAEHENAKTQLEYWKKIEGELRQEIFRNVFANPKEGVNNFVIGNGMTLKAKHTINYTLKETKEGAETSAILDQIEKLGNEGSFLAERLVSWKPDLSLKEYKELDPANNDTHKQIKALVDTVLTTKPGMPTLEVVPTR